MALYRILADLNRPEMLASAGRADARVIESLAELGRMRDPEAITYLLAYAFSPDRAVSRQAAESIGVLYDHVAIGVVALDAEIRRVFTRVPQRDSLFRSRDPYGSWKPLEPVDLARLEGLPFEGVLLGMTASHKNGFVRQEAVRRLARFDSAAVIPFLLLRANDWVDAVAEEAAASLRARLTPASAPHFARRLDMVARLLGWERRDHRALVESVYRLIREIDDGAHVLAALESSDNTIKRLSYPLAYGLPRAGEAQLLGRALGERDVVIQRWALKTALEKSSPEIVAGLIPLLDRSRSPLLRREALRLRAARFPREAAPFVLEALFDPNASVRESARFLAARAGEADALALYRAELEKSEPGAAARIAAALAGVGETGRVEDAALVRRFAADPRARVRREVVRAVFRLDPENGDDLFASALEDSSGAVARMGREALERKAGSLDASRLWSVVVDSKSASARKSAVRLLARLPKWAALEHLLRAEALADPGLARETDEALECWLRQSNLSFSQPSEGDAARLAPLLAASRSPLKTALESVLRAAL